jgi:phosphodiesterase/alkaline phosphatase D-like protein
MRIYKNTLFCKAAIVLVVLACSLTSTWAGTYDQYIWETASVSNISSNADILQAELQARVQEILDNGHLAPKRVHYGDVKGEGYFIHHEPGRIILTLAYAYPYLTTAQQQAVVTYVNNEITDGFGPWGQWGKEHEDPLLGTPRQYNLAPEVKGEGWDRYWGLDGQHRPFSYTLYGIWLYAYRTGDWAIVDNYWSKIRDQYNRHGSDGNLYGSMGVHIAMARMAEYREDTTVRDTAISNAEAEFNAGTNFSTIDTRQETPYQKFFDPRVYPEVYHGWLFMNTCPEVGRFMYDYVRSDVMARDAQIEDRWPHWFIRQVHYHGSRWTGDESVGLTMEIYAMRFPIARWVSKENPDVMADWLDAPVGIGDCYYIESLIQTIEAYGSTSWEDVRTGGGDPPPPPPPPGDMMVNFQTSASTVPTNYVGDYGDTYGSRNGLTYGWSSGNTSATRDRGAHSDDRYDTLCHFNGYTWEIAVNNGDYTVFIVCGDSAYTNQINSLNVEGIQVDDPDGEDNFDEYTLTGVSVSDGKLTISGGSGANNPKICFIEITEEGGDPDTTAPDAVTNLAASNPTSTSIDLSWTAPGDDGSTGTASSYDIRYSTSVIDDTNWDSATQVSGEPTPATAGSSESVTVAGLSEATTYYFAIKTSDEAGNVSAISNSPNATTDAPDTTAPDAVTNLATSAATSSTITLSWTAPGDDGSSGTAESYDLRYSTSAIDASNFSSATQVSGEPAPQASGSSESVVVSGLNAETTYYFAIKTADEAGNVSTISNVPTGTTLAGSTDPLSITNLSANTGGSYTVKYDALNASADDVYTDRDYNFSSVPAALAGKTYIQTANNDKSNTGLQVTFDINQECTVYVGHDDRFSSIPSWMSGWTNSGMSVVVSDGDSTGATLYSKVFAAGTVTLYENPVNGEGNNMYNIVVVPTGGGTPSDTTAPDAVTNLAASNATTTSIDLAWTAPGDDGSTGTASSYDIRYSTSAIDETNWSSATQVLGEPAPQAAGSSEAVTVSGLASDTTYYFAIKTADEVGNISAVSNSPSETTLVDTDTTAPDAVTNLATSNATSSSIDLSWTAPGDDGSVGTASSYDIRYSTSAITESNWSSATQVSGEPAPQAAGSSEAVTVSGLTSETTYYFAIKTTDDAGNVSGVSNSPSGTTTAGGSTDPLSITNLSANSGLTYTVQYGALGVNTGDAYTDRNYDFNSVPSAFVGETYIQTPNDDKGNTSLSVSFDINQECTVYVAHDDRIVADPSWLSTWTDTGEDLYIGDDFANAMSLHSKVFAAGTVTLAENTTDGTESQISMYNIVVIPTGGGGTPPADTTAPAAVSDLSAGNATSSSIDLSWTATGDDGSTGTASSYDVRYSTSPIDGTNFDSASQATGEPTPAASGSSESFTVTGLSADTTYYFAIKVSDEVGNVSTVSNSPNATTQTGGGGGPLSITNLSSSTGETYTVQYDALDANAGDVFTDRDYVFSSVPSSLVGATYIQTANDDKSISGLQVTFDINQECTVYVAHDDRFSSVPSWLSTWTNSGMGVLVSDGGSSGATLYSKVFSAGTVTLYENTVNGQGNNMYNIVVVPTN